VRFVREVNHPNCRMMYDTFHANIEEKNPAEAIRACAAYTAHIHISENDRSTPGQGSVPWDATFKAIKETGYDGWLMIEAFGLALPELAAATKIWRRMFDSEEQLARDGLAFMKQRMKK
jgi:D-psicose/D-tagatose/L-ribulose 3-epimerase